MQFGSTATGVATSQSNHSVHNYLGHLDGPVDGSPQQLECKYLLLWLSFILVLTGNLSVPEQNVLDTLEPGKVLNLTTTVKFCLFSADYSKDYTWCHWRHRQDYMQQTGTTSHDIYAAAEVGHHRWRSTLLMETILMKKFIRFIHHPFLLSSNCSCVFSSHAWDKSTNLSNGIDDIQIQSIGNLLTPISHHPEYIYSFCNPSRTTVQGVGDD